MSVLDPALPRLETMRLVLRRWRESDFDAFAAMMAEPEVARWITLDGKPQDRPMAWRTMATMVGHWALRGYGMFAVELKASGQFIGRVGPWRPEGWPALEIGWALAGAHQRQGLAKEAAEAALGFMFDTLNEDYIVSVIHPDNQPSATLARAIGERLDGVFVHPAVGPIHQYAIRRHEWHRRRADNPSP